MLQVAHRVLAVIVSVVVLLAAWRMWRVGLRVLAGTMVVALVLQMVLGVVSVVTELGYGWVTAHTGGAALLFGSAAACWLVLRDAGRVIAPTPPEREASGAALQVAA
jgi:cytochrome c oxidase assembly protein subunit 15